MKRELYWWIINIDLILLSVMLELREWPFALKHWTTLSLNDRIAFAIVTGIFLATLVEVADYVTGKLTLRRSPQ